MKMKLFVFIITFSLLLSGILVAVAGEVTDVKEEEVKEDVKRGTEPTKLAHSPWPSFGRNQNNTGRSPYDTSHVDGTEKWSFKTGNMVDSSPAIGDDGTIYVGSNDNNLYAINSDGAEKWSFKTGDTVSSSPAIGDDGTIYVGSSDNNLYAINSDGTEKWSFKTGNMVDSSPAIGDDGTIYVGSNDNNLYAINSDGTEKWSFETGDTVFSSPAIGDDGTIYVGSDAGYLYALNPNGTEKWSFGTGGYWVASSPAIGNDGTIYVGCDDGNLFALSPDGSKKWSFETSDKIWSSPAIGDDGTIYVGSNDNNLYAINSDGTEKWSLNTGSDFRISSPVIGSDGTIYIAPKSDNLYGIDPNGTEKWSFEPNGSMESSPAIGKDGTIYIGSWDEDMIYGYLYAITGEEKSVEHTLTINESIGKGKVEVDGHEVTEWPYEEVYNNNTEVELKAFPEEGWYFNEWTGDETGTKNPINITMNSNKSITAVFEEETVEYDLTISTNGEGSTNPSEGTHTYEEGAVVTVEANPANGWYFEEWTGDETGTDTKIDITMDADKSITAVFEEEMVEYGLSININGEGSTSPSEGTHTYEEGTVVTVEATPAEGWEFDEWTGDYTGEESVINIEIDQDKQITANFYEPKELYTLELNIGPFGAVKVNDERVEDLWSNDFEEGEEISLEALPEEGYELDYWEITINNKERRERTDKEIKVLMNEDKSIDVFFKEKPLYESFIDWGKKWEYSFDNFGFTDPGFISPGEFNGTNCYGMSSTAILYYLRYGMGKEEKPSLPLMENGQKADSTWDLSLPADSENNINNVSLSILLHQNFDLKNNRLNFYSLEHDHSEEYEELNDTLSNDKPVLLGLGPNDPHAVVVHGIEVYENDRAILKIYDPNDDDHRTREANYWFKNEKFEYNYGSTTWNEFLTISPDIMKRHWFFNLGDLSSDWKDYSPDNYDIIIGDKDLKIVSEDNNNNYFKTKGDSQTFQQGIPGSAGVTEGNIVAYAIPDEIEYEVDPAINDDSFVYMSTTETNGNGEKELYSYRLNLSSDTSYEYNIEVDNLSQGIDFNPISSSVEVDPTITYTGPDDDYQIFQATDILTEEDKKYEFIVDEWDNLNSTEKETVQVEVYEEDKEIPIDSYGLTNEQKGLKPDEEDQEDKIDTLIIIGRILVIMITLAIIGYMMNKGKGTNPTVKEKDEEEIIKDFVEEKKMEESLFEEEFSK